MLHPLIFHPIFKERIWGGRNLERLLAKPLPPAGVFGESWEITDRPGDVSVVAAGPLAGRDLRWLMSHHERALLGRAESLHGRFPLLVKILDAHETLSLQVHPPKPVAGELGGDPKTEMWYFLEAASGAQIYAGLRRGVTREEFSRRVADGTVAVCFHRLPVRAGEAMFVPAGRAHALGAGTLLIEIQQNSDTTYRVFDWNRRDSSGQGRELHLPQSLASIDFTDFEPGLIPPMSGRPSADRRVLVDDPLFTVSEQRLRPDEPLVLEPGLMTVVGVARGGLSLQHPDLAVQLGAGQFCLIPASVLDCTLRSRGETVVICSTAGPAGWVTPMAGSDSAILAATPTHA